MTASVDCFTYHNFIRGIKKNTGSNGSLKLIAFVFSTLHLNNKLQLRIKVHCVRTELIHRNVISKIHFFNFAKLKTGNGFGGES